ncbi:hypothetical protein QBC43DRAFT_376923 [Cladorrhinum sp. PSN259]|nr:hypothetical protein QBC43DRAFT_376923 [Cladorrhinum sp. PSN259]
MNEIPYVQLFPSVFLVGHQHHTVSSLNSMMKSLIVVSVFCIFRALAWNHAKSEQELESALKTNSRTLVAYIRQEEENSQILEPEWLSAADSQKHLLISIDCSSLPKLCQNQGVSSFPTIRLHHKNGNPSRYRGLRTAHSILQFLERSNRPPISHVTANNITAFQSVDDVVFVGHLGSEPDQEIFTTVAQKYSDRYSFALSSRPNSDSAVIECFNNPDSTSHSTSDITVRNLDAFVKLCSTPLIAEMTRSNELDYYSSGKSIIHYFPSSTQDQNEYITAMRPLAKKYKEYLHFVITHSREFPEAAGMMGLPGRVNMKSEKGRLSVQKGQDVFPYLDGAGDLKSAEVVEGFLGDIIRGKVRPWSGEGQEGVGHDEL